MKSPDSRRKRLALILVLFALPAAALLPACATFDEVEGVPDALHWSYFQGDAPAVVAALRVALTQAGYTVEGVSETTGGGAIVGLSAGSAGFSEVRVEPTTVAQGYQTRAQTHPQGRRLARSLERAIERNM